ncbi:MAG: hypothetical protein KIT64_08660 [Chitinophagaceae bacterium]|nr:hypothetical protein [Chitinophagaceae bacterium]
MNFILRKKPKTKPQFEFLDNYIIEFIGPAGVGKSTLYKKILENANFNSPTIEELNSIIKKDDIYNISTSIHNTLLNSKFQNLMQRGYNAYVNAELINYFSSVIKKDITIQYTPSQKGIILEEGLCHNFSKELVSLNNADLQTITHKRVLIYIRPDDSLTVVKRIRKRQQEGEHTVTHHNGKSDDELKDISKTSITSFDNLIEAIANFQIPYFTVKAEETNNAHLVLQFLKDKKIVTERLNQA